MVKVEDEVLFFETWCMTVDKKSTFLFDVALAPSFGNILSFLPAGTAPPLASAVTGQVALQYIPDSAPTSSYSMRSAASITKQNNIKQ